MITDKDREILDEIRFVLGGRTKSTLVVMVTETYGKRDEVKAELDKMLPEYRAAILDLSGRSITSLFRTIRDDVPQDIQTSKPVEYLLHIFGLEDSLLYSSEGLLGASPLIRELNLERENLFHEFPFCLIIWTTAYFMEKLKMQAPDLWDWITYSYRFDDAPSDHREPDILPLPELHEGFTEERKRRIADLEKRLKDLPLSGDSVRVLRSKFTVYTALGEEYEAASRFDDAIKYYKAALALTADSELGEMARAEILIYLGTVYLKERQIKESLSFLEEARNIIETQGFYGVMGIIYHRIGMAYQFSNNWPKALENYFYAIEIKNKTGNDYYIGDTWHQIGRVYQEQRNWQKALESYHTALEWYERVKMDDGCGGTFHHIGRVYEEQNNWQNALDYYNKALECYHKTGRDDLVGKTNHHIAMVFQKQQNLTKALKYFECALEWNEKTGMDFEMGETLYHIGRVHDDMGNISESLKYYQAALIFFIRKKKKDEQPKVIRSLKQLFPCLSQDQRQTLKVAFPKDIYQLIETGIKAES